MRISITKLYHGTTRRRAEKILREGFKGKRGLSWFARQKGLARQYAHTQARQRHDRPVILECEIPVDQLRQGEEVRVVSASANAVVIQGNVAGKVVSNRRALGCAWSAGETADWANRYLGLMGARRIPPSHHGVQRLQKWIAGRFQGNRRKPISEEELLRHAIRWLPEYFSPSLLQPDQVVRRKRHR